MRRFADETFLEIKTGKKRLQAVLEALPGHEEILAQYEYAERPFYTKPWLNSTPKRLLAAGLGAIGTAWVTWDILSAAREDGWSVGRNTVRAIGRNAGMMLGGGIAGALLPAGFKLAGGFVLGGIGAVFGDKAFSYGYDLSRNYIAPAQTSRRGGFGRNFHYAVA
jgi:hypothetical protein